MKDITPINTILCNLTDKVGYNEEDGSHKLAFFDANVFDEPIEELLEDYENESGLPDIFKGKTPNMLNTCKEHDKTLHETWQDKFEILWGYGSKQDIKNFFQQELDRIVEEIKQDNDLEDYTAEKIISIIKNR